MKAQSLALVLLATGALLVLLFSFLGGPAGAIGFVVVAGAYPFVLMALGAARRRRSEPLDSKNGLGGAVLPIALLLAMVELSLVGMVVFRGQVLDGPWVAGLPLAAALQIYGIFLLPLAVTALGFALTFRRFGVAEADLARLRELAPKDPGSMPILDRPMIVWAAVAYLALMVAIGVWAMRRTRDARDFFIAGQSLGLLVTGLATMSAAFSGFVFIGGPGLVYRMGLASLFICIPVSFTSGLLCWVVAKRLRLLAEARPVYTVSDALLARYRSRAVSGLAAVAVMLGTVAYLGAQLQALGVVIEAVFGTRAALGGWSLPAAMAIGLVVIAAYAIAGGMVAGVYTDLFQGSLMVLAAAGVFFYAMRSGGGLGAIARDIAASPEFGPGFVDPLGSVPIFTAVGFFFVFSVGTLGQPHMLHKFFMLRDVAKLKWMPAVIGGGQAMCVLIWLGVGLAVPALVATGRLAPLVNPDEAAPAFLLGFTPGILAGLVFAGILAAIMSTADSFLNIAAAALVRDLPRAIGWRLPDQLLWGRLAVLAVAVAAALFALAWGDLIALLGTFAFATFGAALAPAIAVGLNWKRVTAGAAAASIATGLGVNLGLELLARQSLFPAPLPAGVLPGTVALAASFLVLLVWSWAASPPVLDADVELVMDL